MSPRKARAALAAAALMLVSLSACGAGDDGGQRGGEQAGSGGSGSGSGWDADAPAEWEDILAAGQKEGSVVVAGFPSHAEPMAKAFKRDTGIDLEFIGGDGSANSAR